MRNTIISLLLSLTLSTSLISCASGTTPIRSKNSKAAEYNASLGAEYLRKDRLRLANEKLSKALQQNPNSENANHYYALLQEKLNNNATALKHFKRAIRVSKRNPDLHNNYGSFLCNMGQYRQAISEFALAVKDPLYKTPEFAYTNAGVCIEKSNSKENPEAYFRRALEIKPQFASALFQMAKLNWKQANASKAQAFLFRYNEVAQPTPESLLLCKKINERLGESALAENCVSQLLSHFPSSKEANEVN